MKRVKDKKRVFFSRKKGLGEGRGSTCGCVTYMRRTTAIICRMLHVYIASTTLTKLAS